MVVDLLAKLLHPPLASEQPALLGLVALVGLLRQPALPVALSGAIASGRQLQAARDARLPSLEDHAAVHARDRCR